MALCDSRSESPLESLSRLVFPRLGLPAPEPQVLIFDAHGVFVARSDFYWDHVGVVGEADGESKYDDGRAILVAEKHREATLEDLELEVARWNWTHAWSQRTVLEHRLSRAYERGLARDRRGIARRWTFETTPRVTVL
ncbi:MAG: hypothetical protein INR67_15355 [Jatrophihabitans endophyticus]|nr:hypothetical protein [Jatrophihabitans endophyticus]